MRAVIRALPLYLAALVVALQLGGCPKRPPAESVAPPGEMQRAAEPAAPEAESFITPPASPGEPAAEADLAEDREADAAGLTPVAAIPWITGYEATMEKAADSGKPALVFFWGARFPPAKMFDDQNWSDLKVRRTAEKFVCGRVDVGQDRDTAQELSVQLIPTVLFLTPDGKELGRIQHLVTPETLVQEMLKVLD